MPLTTTNVSATKVMLTPGVKYREEIGRELTWTEVDSNFHTNDMNSTFDGFNIAKTFELTPENTRFNILNIYIPCNIQAFRDGLISFKLSLSCDTIKSITNTIKLRMTESVYMTSGGSCTFAYINHIFGSIYTIFGFGSTGYNINEGGSSLGINMQLYVDDVNSFSSDYVFPEAYENMKFKISVNSDEQQYVDLAGIEFRGDIDPITVELIQ